MTHSEVNTPTPQSSPGVLIKELTAVYHKIGSEPRDQTVLVCKGNNNNHKETWHFRIG